MSTIYLKIMIGLNLVVFNCMFLFNISLELVEKLEETDMSNPGWLAIAKQLSEKVHHHLKEEEHKFFQQAGKILEDAEKEILAKKYLAEYHKYKTVEA